MQKQNEGKETNKSAGEDGCGRKGSMAHEMGKIPFWILEWSKICSRLP
jgi:hypothetical protein